MHNICDTAPVKALLDPQKSHYLQAESHWLRGRGWLEVAHLVLEVSRLHLVGNLFLFVMLFLCSKHFTGKHFCQVSHATSRHSRLR